LYCQPLLSRPIQQELTDDVVQPKEASSEIEIEEGDHHLKRRRLREIPGRSPNGNP
jgi:hypothetical protein